MYSVGQRIKNKTNLKKKIRIQEVGVKQAYKQTQNLMHRQHKTDLIFFFFNIFSCKHTRFFQRENLSHECRAYTDDIGAACNPMPQAPALHAITTLSRYMKNKT